MQALFARRPKLEMSPLSQYIIAAWFLVLSCLYIYFQRSSLVDLGILIFLVGIIGLLYWLLARSLRGITFGAQGFVRTYSAGFLLLIFAVIMWFTISALLIVISHIPLMAIFPYLFAVALHTVAILGVYLALLVFCAAIGRAALAFWFTDPLDLEMSSFLRAVAAGLACMALFFYIAALFGFLNIWALSIFVVCGAAMIVKYWGEFSKILLQPRIPIALSLHGDRSRVAATVLGCIIAAYALFIIINAAGFFPSSVDDLHTYYNLPRLYAQHGAIVDFPYDAANNGTLAFAYVYVPLLLLGDYLLNFVSLFFFILSIVGTYEFSKQFGGPATATRAAFFFFSMPLAFWFMLSAKIDYLVSFIIIVACLQILAWMRGKGTRYLVLASVCIGFSAAVKYTTLLLLPALIVALIVWSFFEKKSFSFIVRSSMLIVLGATLGFAPWGIRTHNVYGSPFYPYGLSGSYNSPNTELLAQKKLISKFYSTMYAGGHVFNPAKPWWQNVLVLVTGKSKYVANRIGPLFFGLLPLILFSLLRREGRSETVWAITLVGVTMVLWFIIIKLQVWYVLYIFPLWSAMLASASTHIRQRWFIPFVVIVLSVVSLMHVSYARAPLLLFYGNALSEAQYDAIFGPGISLNTYLNTVVRAEYPRYVVFPMGEHRQVFLEDNDLHLYADNRSLSAWVPLALSSMTDDQINAWFLKKGITHAYSVYADIEEWRASWCPTITTPKDPCPQFDPVMQRFYQLASKWTIVSQNEDWVLYKVQ